jgi:hypothetical protein
MEAFCYKRITPYRPADQGTVLQSKSHAGAAVLPSIFRLRTSIQIRRTSFQVQPYAKAKATVLQRKFAVLQNNEFLIKSLFFNTFCML